MRRPVKKILKIDFIFRTTFTLRIGYVSLDPLTLFWITVIAFLLMSFFIIVYVLLKKHDIAVENCKDRIYDLFDGNGNIERQLFGKQVFY